jgi:DNA processing protein
MRYHFPSRNRIISGLSKAVVAIQAPLKSGVFSTVKWALDYGRDVYALPGDITTEVSKGTNRLIKMGAIPITGYKDILDNSELEIVNKKEIKQKKIINLSEDEKRLYDLIETIPKTLDTLAYESNMKVEEILNLLIHLEINGLIREVSGKRFIRENI